MEERINVDLQKIIWGYELDLSGSGWTQVVCCCKSDYQVSFSIKYGDFFAEGLRATQ
jgi:hypothetical protein